MRIIKLAAAGVLLSVSATSACINDTHTESAESEFRSTYHKAVDSVAASASTPWGIIALSAGVGLIIGGTFTVIHFSRK